MRNRRTRQWFLGTMVALVALDAAVYFAWVRPLQSAALDEKEMAVLEREMERSAAEVARLERIEHDLPGATVQLDRFVTQHFLAEQAGYSALVGELARTVADAGVRSGRVDFRSFGARDRPELLRIEMTTTVEGSYPNLLRFLEALERSENFYLLKRLELASTTSGGSLRLDFTLETYLRRLRL